ncbi:hypothetical protein E4J89_03890 [Arthrobacter sp. CAU 1506]|uniref:hypothetical protein n=1 Tax=Arthrobacter sp. CAU 1506 TaxID=2560052 RepID=UPI0010ACB4A5|nr:hypothetical protein [Arthrobacter sp. CAU 1506]TJY71401.1 hypothetical protein E4J89_03890 [Arthrobacter sp. CAU 1506]
MRAVLALVSGLLAVLLAGAALCGAWANQRVFDRDGFVSLAAPLGGDAEFRAALASAVTEEVSGSANLPAGLQQLVLPIVERTAGAVTELDGFPQALNEALANSHTLTLSGKTGSEAGITLDIAPIVDLAVTRVAEALGTNLPVPERVLVPVGSAQTASQLAFWQDLAAQWWVAALLAGGALMLMLLAARRRTTALAWAGIGAAALGGLLWLVAVQVPPLAEGAAGRSELAAAFVGRLAALAVADFRPWAAVFAGVGLVVAVAGFTLRALLGGDRRNKATG